MVVARVLVFAMALTGLGSSATNPQPLVHDAYIWQRQWTPQVSAAVRQAADMVQGWRVLGAVMDKSGKLQPITPDWPALEESGRPIVVVVRMDGPMTRWDMEALLSQIHTLLERWRGQGARLAGVEIDHDSPTARLGEYGRFLARLKESLGPALPLSVTALPTWLSPGPGTG